MPSTGAEARPKRVADVMRRDFITVAPGDKLLEAAQIMQLARLRHLLVVEGGQVLGVLTYRDLQRESLSRTAATEKDEASSIPLASLQVSDLMIRSPNAVTPETPLEIAATRMCRLDMGCLPVVQDRANSRLIGLLTETDLLRAAYDRWFSTPP